MSRWLRQLNPEQREAVRTVDGPLLVLAGAGSGKTRVITHRIALMLEGGIAPERILAVTFTNKAAEEMRQRLTRMVGADRALALNLGTFHAIGLQMLKEEARRRRKRGGRFTIFDTGDQLGCLRELASRLRFDRAFDLAAILSRISAHKNAFCAVDEVPASDDPYDQAAAALYPRYCEALEAYAAVDFDDLVCRPTLLMERSESCRRRWAERFAYVLVDEYQDTNGAQLRMLRAIAGSHRNLCVVGDDDQSIYGWRGADVTNILRFERHFPGAKVVYLERNYRSVGAVLELANRVIADNADRHPKVLRSTREQGSAVRLLIAPDGDAEASWIARQIRAAVQGGQVRDYDDIAVLYRSNVLAAGLEPALREQGIPYRVLGGAALFERKEVKDVIALLRLCVNPYDELSLRRVINTPPRGIGPRTVAKLAAWAEQHDSGLLTAVQRAETILGAQDRALAPLSRFAALIKRSAARLRRGADAEQVAQGLVEEVGLRREIERSAGSEQLAARRWAAVSGLLGALGSYCRRASEPSLGEFLNRMALASADDDLSEAHRQRVTLCTLHGAKGLEFPMVFLVGLEEGLLPHDRTLNPHQHDHVSGEIAEERRLFYVGITRARDTLVLTRANQRLVRGRLQPRAPSRFFEPVDLDRLQVEDIAAAPPMEQVRSMMAELRQRWSAAADGEGQG